MCNAKGFVLQSIIIFMQHSPMMAPPRYGMGVKWMGKLLSPSQN